MVEEKECRKAEREDKKRQKEEQKRKVKGRERKKAEEKAKKAKEAAENKKQAKGATKTSAEKHTASDITLPSDSNEEETSSSKEPPSKKFCRLLRYACTDSEIDQDMCCMCFRSHSEDVVDGGGV